MKYVLIAAAVLVWSCKNSDSSPAAAPANQDSVNQAALTDSTRFTDMQFLDSTDQNLGKVRAGQVVDIVWRLKNTGNKPLVIGSVQPGCGCTVADKPTEPIAPGGEGVIRAKFDSKNQSPGEHKKSVTVTANTRQHAYYLNFSVEVTP